MSSSEKAKTILEKFVQSAKDGTLPKKISEVTHPSIDVPSNKWSINNRLAMAFQGTLDARGFCQWNEEDRGVKKGSHAIYILAPMVRSINDEGSGEKKQIVTGFRCIPVFRVEDTQGKPLAYENIPLPKLHLSEVADKWGIEIEGRGYGNNGVLGTFFISADKITLASPAQKVFLHELSHASQKQLGMLDKTSKQKGTVSWLEITAELSAMVLAELVGLTIEEVNAGSTYEYIKMFINSDDVEQIGKKIMSAINDVAKIIGRIVECSELRLLPCAINQV